MWSQLQLNEILAHTGLLPPNGFLQAARALLNEFEEYMDPNEYARCDPLYFHRSPGVDLSLIPHLNNGFLPFWQENNYCETVLIGCDKPFLGCIAALGVLLNESGGLLSGHFSEFFSLFQGHAKAWARTASDLPLVSLVDACAYCGTFSDDVSDIADQKLRDGADSRDALHYAGAISESAALRLLTSSNPFDIEVAAWRLGGIRSLQALPSLNAICEINISSDHVGQHVRAARRALQRIQGAGDQFGMNFRFPIQGLQH
jgi:hypothetical protein